MALVDFVCIVFVNKNDLKENENYDNSNIFCALIMSIVY